MSFNVNKTVSWRAGEGTPEKYVFNLNVNIDVVSVSGNTATISMVGTTGVQNNPLNSRNSWAASDIALLTTGNADPWEYGFTPGVSYYKEGLPFSPNAPQSVVDKIIIQFRGDTWRSDPNNANNRSSLYYRPSGVILDSYDGSVYQEYAVSTTFQVDVSGGGNIPILTWTTSGANSSTDYNWISHVAWASWFDLDYRAGATYNNGWLSHNRNNGASDIRTNSSWQTMRTVNGGVGTDNPPYISNGSVWHNQRKIGTGG